MSLTLSNSNQEREIRKLAEARKEAPEKVLSELVGDALSDRKNGDHGGGKSKDLPTGFFAPPPTLEALSAAQGVKVVSDFDALLGDFWPEDETTDEFLAAVRKWRAEGGKEQAK